MQIIINIFAAFIIILIIYFINKKSLIKENIKNKILNDTKFYRKIKKTQEDLYELNDKKIININNKWFSQINITIISILSFLIVFIIIYSLIKVLSTSIILSIPSLFIFAFIIKWLTLKHKEKIMLSLPSYVVNLKNRVEQNNNIIDALKETPPSEHLKQYIDKFNNTVERGININVAFETLKQEVDLSNFSDLVMAFQTCYINGGDFSKILEKYVVNITKENLHKEQSKEEAYSSILTLIIMMLINIYLLFGFVFKNAEYSSTIRETTLGHLILNFNAVSYILIGYLVFKIYKIGD